MRRKLLKPIIRSIIESINEEKLWELTIQPDHAKRDILFFHRHELGPKPRQIGGRDLAKWYKKITEQEVSRGKQGKRRIKIINKPKQLAKKFLEQLKSLLQGAADPDALKKLGEMRVTVRVHVGHEESEKVVKSLHELLSQRELDGPLQIYVGLIREVEPEERLKYRPK